MSDMVVVNMDSSMSNSPSRSTSIDSGGVEADSKDIDNANNNDVGGYNGVEPREGMEFPTYIAAYNFYNAYARVKGFSVRISSSNFSRRTRELISKTFLCNKEGKKCVHDKREHGRVINRRRDTRVGCKARLRVCRTERNTWSVSKFVSEHTNHEFTSPDKVKRHYSHRKLHRTKDCQDVMDKLQDARLNPSTIPRLLNVASGSQEEALRAKFNSVLELVVHSPTLLEALETFLSDIMEKAKKEAKAKDVEGLEITNHVGPSAPPSHTIEKIPQITVCDTSGPAKTKGRPKKLGRMKLVPEQAQDAKETKKRTCSRCHQLGHYRTSCTNPIVICPIQWQMEENNGFHMASSHQ